MATTRIGTILRYELHIREGSHQRVEAVTPLPFTIGRRAQNHLVLAWPQVSRDHARLVEEDGGLIFEDLGSSHGTLLNGQPMRRARLSVGDVISFSNCPGVELTVALASAPALSLLEMRRRRDEPSSNPEFAWLHMLLEFGRRLHTGDVLDEVLAAMTDIALRLTGAERGLVFLRDASGALTFAVGRNAQGEAAAATNLSHSTLERAAASATPVLWHDTRRRDAAELGQSILSHDLRTVIALPLRARDTSLGVLYLDSHAASQAISRVGQDVLQMLAAESAQLVANAQLVREQEAARALERELALAASIQQGLMSADPPALGHVKVRGVNLACRQIGGDFYDFVALADGGLGIVLADVSGKGPAAALLAASLHGIVHAQLLNGTPLPAIAAMCNQFLWCRLQGEKYATLLILRLAATGAVEYLNCGHLQPLVAAAGVCSPLEGGNVPVGLFPAAEYTSCFAQLPDAARVLLATDGVTEASDSAGEQFGEARLAQLALTNHDLSAIVTAVRDFSCGAPLADDLTLVEIEYRHVESAQPSWA